ncbi:hypothetical protein G3I33_17535 [Streptomyces sp. SID9124]|nr:hypothetical protein [Streptomyces sp. SID9124]
MDSSAIILAVAGVVSVGLFSIKGLLDQVPDVIESASKARDSWHRFKKPNSSPPADEPPQADDDQEPPLAA